MEERPKVMNPSTLMWATEHAKESVADALKKAQDLQQDPSRDQRLKRHECLACYYVFPGRIGGASITKRPCMCCGQEQWYANTCTDVLCLTCAQAKELCKHCGADMHLRTRRKHWPEPCRKEKP